MLRVPRRARLGARDVIRMLPDQQRRSWHGDGEAAAEHNRQVDYVVAHIRDGRGFDSARLEQRGKGQSFVGCPLKYQVDSQIFRAQFNAA